MLVTENHKREPQRYNITDFLATFHFIKKVYTDLVTGFSYNYITGVLHSESPVSLQGHINRHLFFGLFPLSESFVLSYM
jgi:hypothetical protein